MSLITWYSNKMCKVPPSSPNVNSTHSSTFSSLSASFKFSFSSCYHGKSTRLSGGQQRSSKGAKLEEDPNDDAADEFHTKSRTASHADTSASDEEIGNHHNLAIVDPAAATATSVMSECNESSAAVQVIEYIAKKDSAKSVADRPKSTISLSTFEDPTNTLAQNLLESALGPDSKIRKTIIKRAEAILTGEIFCFYAAILKWEQLAKEYQLTHRHRRKVETDARRIVALFVAPNAPYENGCLSGQTKIRLLMMSNMAASKTRPPAGTRPSLGGPLTDTRLFCDAKEELKRDILGNPVLRKLVQEEIGYYRSLHHGAPSDFR